jgi:hypothetical protein
MEIVSREAAQEARQTKYFTGLPCKHGHIAERLVSNGVCLECKRIWRAAYYAERGEEENRNRAAYYAKHKDDELARKSRYNGAKRDKRTATENKRRSVKMSRVPSWFGEFDQLVEDEAYHLAKLRSAVTGAEWHVDHMIPLQARLASGLHCGANLQVIPAVLNTRKLNRMILTEPHQWLASA